MSYIVPDFSSVRPDIAPTKKEMLSVRKEGSKYFFRINSSSLSVILSCARKSFYSLHEELKSRSESPALTFGKGIHKGLEVFYATPREQRGFPVNFNDHSTLMAHGTPPPEKHFLYDSIAAFVKAAQPLASLPDTDKRSIVNGIWTLQHYFKDYIDDVYEIYSDEKGPFVERSFSLIIYDTPELQIKIFGTLDFIFQHSINKSILPGDHKTVSQLGSDFYNRIKPNHQYTGYVMGAQECFGISSQQFMVNGLQVKPRPKTARGTPPSFVRQITDRTPADIAEFKESVTEAVFRYIGWLEKGVWPIGNVDTCAMWGGCNYLDICNAPEKLRDNILESKFISLKGEECQEA